MYINGRKTLFEVLVLGIRDYVIADMLPEPDIKVKRWFEEEEKEGSFGWLCEAVGYDSISLRAGVNKYKYMYERIFKKRRKQCIS